MAARFWVNGGVDNNWGTIGNWSTTSGGGGGSAVPTSSDDVTLDGAGNVNCTLNTTGRACKSLTVTAGYTATMTFTNNLQVFGNCTLGANMNFAGAQGFLPSANGTWTSNGKVSGVFLSLQGVTVTLADDWTAPSLGVGTNTSVLNGFSYTTTGGTAGYGLNTVKSLSGTTTIIFGGSSALNTWQCSANISCGNPIVFNSSGTITISGVVGYSGTSIVYTAGTVVTTGSELSLFSVPCTLNTAGIVWNNVTFLYSMGTGTMTLSSLLTVTGTLSFNYSSGVTLGGTAGFICGTLRLSGITNFTLTLTSGLTYTVTGSFITATTLATTNRTLNSTIASSPAYLTVNYGATIAVGNLSVTDIDSSGGRIIWNWYGTNTLTRTVNWKLWTNPLTFGKMLSSN